MSQVDLVVRVRFWAAWLLLCAGVIGSPLVAQAVDPAGVALRPPSVPAAGRQVAELEVADFGRYAISVASAQGTALQVLDRMTGAGELAGEAGKRDGRIDLFLDRGTVRLLTFGSQLATGDATLSVVPFRERGSAPQAPGPDAVVAGAAGVQLVEGKPVDGELADFEQLSWWIEIGERRRVTFEAAGRHLADLRLWQNGSWLVDAAPQVSVIEPRSGRPLRLCQLTADLTPGLYRLSAYGGPEVPWSSAGGAAVERPFHLRYGWPRDAQTLRERRTIGPLGFDRVLVSGAADYFRLELPEPLRTDEDEAGIEVTTLQPDSPFSLIGDAATLTKENVPPVAEIRTGADPDRQAVVTVRGAVGQPYVLQHFARTRQRELRARTTSSKYWVSTVHAGPVGDAIEPTAILVSRGDGAKRPSAVLASEAVQLSLVAGWARRFNLPETASLYLEVREAGAYVLESRGVAAQFRLEPLFLDRYPEGWQSPPLRGAPVEWQLDPGFYVLTLQPLETGIAEVEIAAKGSAPVAVAPPRPSVQLGVVSLSSKLGYNLYVSLQPEVEAGMVVRELPLDLAAALPLALGAGEEVELPVRAAEASALRALTEEGGGLEISIDGGPWTGNAVGDAASRVERGEHRIRVRSTSDRTVLASVGLVAAAQLAATPLPELPAATLAALPAFPRLAATSAQALDLGAGEARTFLVGADEAALYRFESTGLLATAGALRTRTRASLLSQEQNGVGRNFALAAYLREGDYQLTVQPRGASAGHLGLELARAPIEEAGALAEDLPARATIDPRRAVAYRWSVREAGRFQVSAWGLRRPFAMRLEDADGWPVAAPLAQGQLSVELEPGEYRLIVLPQPVAARAIVLAARERAPVELSGHGPHRLQLDREASNLWLEPAEGAPREPDRWRFILPAATGVTINLSEEMMGSIRAVGAISPPSGAVAALPAVPNGGLVPPGRGFRGELAAGEYELQAESSRSNNRLPYRIVVRTDDLVDGSSRELRAPGEITLAVGSESQVEIASLGNSDVRARLMTELGAVVASSDDRPDDWNFLIAERLAPGRYRLRVDPVGEATAAAATTVTMRVLRERTATPLAAVSPAARQLFEVADDAVLVPLTRLAGAEIVAVGARAGESLGMALEERSEPGGGRGRSGAGVGTADGWRVRSSASGRSASLALPLAESTAELRLRLWSLDRRPATVEVAAYGGALSHRSEGELARGFELEALPGLEPGLAVAVVDLEAPGCFRRDVADPQLLQALSAGSSFEPAAPTLAPVGFALPLAAALTPGGSARVQAGRAFVGDGESLALMLPPGTPITCDVADGGAAVVELEATAGEPVIGFLDGRGMIGPSTAFGPASGGRVRSAKGAGKGRAVELWNSGASLLEARLTGWLSPTAAAERIAWGAGRASVGAREARLLELPAGEKELRLTLAAGTSVLALAPASSEAADDAEALVWAPIDATTETLITRSDRLLLLGTDSAPGEVSLELVPLHAATSPAASGAHLLTDQQRLERRFSFAGAFRVPVAAADAGGPRRLHLRGAGVAHFVGGDGRVQRGSDFELSSAGGSLRFDHNPGLVSAWIDSITEKDSSASPSPSETWGMAGETEAIRTQLPAALELDGALQAFELELAAPSLVKVRGTTAVAVATFPGGTRPGRFEVYPQGAQFDAVLPSGSSRLVLRGLAGETLSGTVTLVAEPLAPLDEGLGPESLLAPGDSRGYAFHVARAGAVGVGVRADQGGVETVLFDAAGGGLGQGVVQWAKLEPGDYALVVTAPAEGRPARVRPALVGASPPGSGPSPEEARRFLALAAGEAPAVAGVAGAEDLPADWLGVRAAEGADDESGYGSGEEESYGTTDEGEWNEESESSDGGRWSEDGEGSDDDQ